jgi:hypothetical protein
MSEIDQLLQEFPPGVRERIRHAWDGMRFERGERAKASDLRAESRSLTRRMLRSLRGLGRCRPPREEVRQAVGSALVGGPGGLPGR